MSYSALKTNLESLINSKRYKVSQVEELAGLKYGNLNNILTGRSKKPSGEILLSIANVFGVSVEDLFHVNPPQVGHYLDPKHMTLISHSVQYITEQLSKHEVKIFYNDLMKMIKEIYEYSSENSDMEIDKKFIDWYIKQNFNIS